ncbi:uncharacterized protein LOC126835860 [Adelges cooleyi]|uniref:uncharacterized protein LOC126835860 n=1 Tax=Adelges cooleyi TaxID=133065 RepID=UPI0021809113|nr:uncharacterized protein LOC126835860 [Adelges cooleyi]
MARLALAIILLGCCSFSVRSTNDRLREVFSWKQVDFVFPDQQTRQAAINSREYVQANNMPLGLEVWRDKLFITVPRWKSGVASTLNYVSLGSSDAQNRSPKLIPYPKYEQNRLAFNSTERIVSVFRINVDQCDRLWLVDTGLDDIWGEANQVQTPKLMIYDLKTDKLIRQYTFKADDMKPDSFFANVLADTTNKTCGDAYAYIPDLGAYGLVVYSFATNTSWRVKHHYFHFDPLAGNYHVGGMNFQWTDGIFGVALSPVRDNGFRTLYFHPLSSTREFSVSTRILQNASIASDSYYEYKVLGSRGPNTQASGSSLDEATGTLFYTQVNKDGIGCWNSYRCADEYSADTNVLVASDSTTMEFPNDLKVDKTGTLWVLSDKLPRFLFKGLDPNEINYRIFNAPVNDIIKNTVCDVECSNRNRSPVLIPYPNYQMNRLPSRRERAVDHIINTYRTSVDVCDRLWVIDMGIANGTSFGEPQLFIFDLNTDRLLRQFTVTSDLRRSDGSTWFPGLLVDADRQACDRAFAYLPDIGWGMVVYNFQTNRAWRLEHHYFYFDPLSTIFNINGVRLEWTDGVFGLALSERHSDGYRTLYFSALASTRMFSVNTRVLQSNSSVSSTFDQYIHHGHRPSGMQAASMSMDTASGALFYSLVNQDAIGCWNPRRYDRHSTQTSAIVAQDSTTLVFPADLKVDFNSNLWVLSDRMPVYRFQVYRFNVNDVNYRVLSAPVAEVIRGTVCDGNGGSSIGNSNNPDQIDNYASEETAFQSSRPSSNNNNFNNNNGDSEQSGFQSSRNSSRPSLVNNNNTNRGWSTPGRRN